MKTFKKVILFVIIAVFLIFSFQNREDIMIRFFNWSLMIPTSLMIVTTYILGMFTGGIILSLLKKLLFTEEKVISKTTFDKDLKNNPEQNLKL
jgi:uncharacterized integral membrane protein